QAVTVRYDGAPVKKPLLRAKLDRQVQALEKGLVPGGLPPLKAGGSLGLLGGDCSARFRDVVVKTLSSKGRGFPEGAEHVAKKHSRVKHVLHTSTYTGKVRKGKLRTFLVDFNMDIDLPVGGEDPLLTSTEYTATGPITVDTNLTFDVWYTDPDGDDVSVPGPVTVTPAASGGFTWSVPFTTSDLAGHNTFPLKATHTPLLGPVPTTSIIEISASFTTADP